MGGNGPSSYRLRYRISSLRYRLAAWRYRRRHPWQFPADPGVEERRAAFDGAIVEPYRDPDRVPDQAQNASADDSTTHKTYLVEERHGEWIVRRDDSKIASLPSRTTALTLAVLRAQEDPPSEVVVLGRDGAIEEKCEFG